MLHSIAKVAVTLNVHSVTNNLMERLYSNKRRASPHFSKRFQILGYHKVSADTHPFFEPVHPDLFEQQMQFLKACYRVMSLQELVSRAARGEVPERAVAITFDDGYCDNYDYAFPILKKYQFPAMIFVATGAIGTGHPIWHDRIFDAFRFATVSRARLEDTSVPELILDSGTTPRWLLTPRPGTLASTGRRSFPTSGNIPHNRWNGISIAAGSPTAS